MANEQNEQAQNPQEEQLEAHDQQTQAESGSGHLETDAEDLKAQITKLEESLKLEKLVRRMRFMRVKSKRAS